MVDAYRGVVHSRVGLGPMKLKYDFMANPPDDLETPCPLCDVREPHYHIDNSGPVCDAWSGKPHPDWCKATHHFPLTGETIP